MSGSTVGLRYTGHALVDAGVAAITVHAGQDDPRQVTADDLEAFVAECLDLYPQKAVSSYLDVIFTGNYLHKSLKTLPDQRRRLAEADRLGIFRLPPGEHLPPCVFCGRPGVHLGSRLMVPLASGEDTVNFYPQGRAGLSLCGLCALALQALPWGAPCVEGRQMLVLDTQDRELLLSLVRRWQSALRRRAALGAAETAEKKATFPALRPWLIEELAQLEADRRGSQDMSLVAYRINNFGQSARVKRYELPGSVVRLVRRSLTARFRPVWDLLSRRGQRGNSQNRFYEVLWDLPDGVGRLVRQVLLPAVEAVPDALPPSWWEWCAMMLEEVVWVEPRRVELIRTLGDALAEEVRSQNDRRLLDQVRRGDRYGAVRALLIRVSGRRLGRGEGPLLGLDDFLTVFEEGDAATRLDWRLAWDLVSLRLLERLYETGWVREHRDALTAATEEETSDQEEK